MSHTQEDTNFKSGKIEDVIVRPIKKFVDERGWLAELWCTDQVDELTTFVMTYISSIELGVVRGPHEHVD